MKKNSYLFRLVRNRKILREKEKKQREPIVRPIFDRREIVSAISISTFNYRKSARNEVMAVGGGKNLGNANAGRTENETRPSFPGFKHSRIYYRRACSPVRGPRPPRWPATNSHFFFQDRGKNRIIPSWSVLLGYLLVWMISLNAMLREHVSDRSIGKRNDSMTISALLFSRRFRSFGCVIYVLRTIFSFFFFHLLLLLKCRKHRGNVLKWNFIENSLCWIGIIIQFFLSVISSTRDWYARIQGSLRIRDNNRCTKIWWN